jgi:hypothetical protein
MTSCGGACIEGWTVQQLQAFMAQKHVYFDGLDKPALLARISDWARVHLYANAMP